MITIEQVAEGIFRVRNGGAKDGSALNRYGFIASEASPAPAGFQLEKFLPGFQIDGNSGSFQAEAGEDWIGFGDITRTRMYHRGHKFDCWVRNVKSYVPVPFFLSTRGYAVLVNSTHRVEFDMAASQPETVRWMDHSGRLDFYLFTGGSFLANIRLYTQLTGKPQLPPEWAFGLWYICRTQANDYEAVNDALNFRREGIPCDVIGLEPGWMETNYDASTEKKWSQERFPIPSWCPNGPHNFINAIKRMGFHFELWECNEYDLLYEEERRLKRQVDETVAATGNFQDGAEADEHFSLPRFADTITKKGESWFEHHKKFIDQGADFFKQDGAYQVNEHPDRVWGGKMLDGEMHNLYPLLFARQMYEGFQSYTSRRPVVFTVSGWTGFQAWAGTWSGDTGGRLETLGGMLNTAVMSHNWQTNDMEVMQPEGIHFGYLQPWSQINSWTYFRMPWIQGDKLLEMHKFYSRFRSRLIPYLYSWAYQTTVKGLPLLLRPLQIEFENDPACRDIMHEYLLGRDLLVSIYKKETRLPAGRWKNFWTGELYDGNQNLTLEWPEERGGNLFVREGAIIPFGPLMQYRKEKPVDEIELLLFPGPDESVFELYDDDGVSFDHRQGKFALTRIACRRDGAAVIGEVAAAAGEYPVPANRSWVLKITLPAAPHRVTVDGQDVVSCSWDKVRQELTLPVAKPHFSFNIA